MRQRKGGEGRNRKIINLCYVYVPDTYNEGKNYVLWTCTKSTNIDKFTIEFFSPWT